MNKWKLLKSALQGKRDSDSAASIHRNDGIFPVLKKRPVPWQWAALSIVFQPPDSADVEIEAITLDKLKELCRNYMQERDAIEIIVRLQASVGAEEQLWGVLDSALAEGCCRLKNAGVSTSSAGDEGEERVSEGVAVEVYWQDATVTPSMLNCKYYEWTLPSGDVVFAREKAKDAGIGVNQLLSHKLYGVDNTGNVKVWAAESMLLHVLLSNYRNDFENRSVLELGGGLTGVCALGLSASIPSCRVVVTDGHPDCVSNQNICIRMNNQARSTGEDKSKLCVTSHLLRWSKGDPQNDLAEILENNKHHSKDADGKFERIVAADCLFFRDFHDDLVWLLQSALAPNGVIFMLQPARGGTMDEFLAKAEASFSIAIMTEYDDTITDMHRRYVSESGDDKTLFDPDIHYPVLLILTHRSESAVSV